MMNLKPEELVKALRCCNTEEFSCKDCALHREFPSGICSCGGEPCDIAADQIERDQKEITELREKIEWLARRADRPHPAITSTL